MLLQIAEPGQSPAPHESKLAVGIDLGTTNSLVASVRSGTASPLPDENGNHILPSVVYYQNKKHQDEGHQVGTEARSHAQTDPSNTIISVKRLIGRSLADIQTRYPLLPYDFLESDNGLPLLQTKAGVKNPIEVSADILKALNKRAENTLGGELEGVVITVPAYFDDAQRAGTKDAATLAGMKVLRLLNEPTAAAIAYGLDSGKEGVIAVYDLGGGTFDISILRLSKGIFEVLATGGDSALGGDDFDHLIANYFQNQLGLASPLSAQQNRTLLDAATEAKIALSKESSAEVSLFNETCVLTRDEFESLIQPLIKKTLLSCRRVLKDADVDSEEVLEVVMVGGSTRILSVREMVGDFFGRTPLTTINPDEVVAIGAAIQADILVGNKPDSEMLLLDVIPLSLGIETMGGLVEKIIPRNTTIPVAKAQEFTTFKDGQTGMIVHVTQGERELIDDCRSLAKFSLKGIPPMAAGAAHIRVTYQVDADGLLSVTAMEKSTGVQAEIQVKPSYGLSDDEIANMLRDSMTHARDDMEARALSEQKVEADRVIEGLVAAMKTDGDALLTDDESKELIKAIEALIALRNGNNADAIEQGIKETDKASQEFASRRMDISIRRALSGQSVDDI
ncbi:Fe-S protein assembly chaperone HscA [Vibrio sp. VB16]|uniref:Fe-S protein assembly chaperone HscA n=1 Tax=Vibrio sp. VB16 TaxID=2785746 RepID=UPI00189DDE81|nr:Fe-S protein assembly chaperone HscA [Vibrio sp. VB16]UGA55361.1 Fe-S protein assembly chaperone HscA [Vibrio sp. VB16]